MSTGNHIKNSALHTFHYLKPKTLKLLTLMLFGLMVIVENCSSSEGESEEQDGRQHANLTHKRPLPDLIPEEELRYDESLLEKVKVDRAQSQMSAIVDFISLFKNPKFFNALKKKYEGKGVTGEQIETIETLINYLKEEASKAIREDPTLATYLKGLRTKNDNLIELSQKLLDHRRLLLDFSQSQSETIEKLLEQITTHEKKNDELSRENKSQSEIIERFSEQFKEQSEKLKAHQEKIDGLSRENREQSEIIATFSQQLRKQQEKIEELSRKTLSPSENVPSVPEQGRVQNSIVQDFQKSDRFQKYIIPLTSFTLGASVATIFFLGYYRVTKTI